MNPQFISIEGLEGAGKSTQRDVLAAWVAERFGQPMVTREPGGTVMAEQIRQVLLAHHDEPVDVLTELLLMFAARRQHFSAAIQPALAKGQWVVSDRFTDASFAYQGGGRGIPWEHIVELENLVLQGVKPDLTLWLDCPAEVGLARARQRGELDRIETEDIAFFERCRAAYERRYNEDPDRIVWLDATGSIESVSATLIQALEARYS